MTTNKNDLTNELRLQFSLVPWCAIVEMALALQDGCQEFGEYNWRDEEVKASTIFNKLMRHLLRWYAFGENQDEATGPHHLGKVMATCAIALDAIEADVLHDDRPTPPSGRDVITDGNKKWEARREQLSRNG